jgi:hypothetical protein
MAGASRAAAAALPWGATAFEAFAAGATEVKRRAPLQLVQQKDGN